MGKHDSGNSGKFNVAACFIKHNDVKAYVRLAVELYTTLTTDDNNELLQTTWNEAVVV